MGIARRTTAVYGTSQSIFDDLRLIRSRGGFAHAREKDFLGCLELADFARVEQTARLDLVRFELQRFVAERCARVLASSGQNDDRPAAESLTTLMLNDGQLRLDFHAARHKVGRQYARNSDWMRDAEDDFLDRLAGEFWLRHGQPSTTAVDTMAANERHSVWGDQTDSSGAAGKGQLFRSANKFRQDWSKAKVHIWRSNKTPPVMLRAPYLLTGHLPDLSGREEVSETLLSFAEMTMESGLGMRHAMDRGDLASAALLARTLGMVYSSFGWNDKDRDLLLAALSRGRHVAAFLDRELRSTKHGTRLVTEWSRWLSMSCWGRNADETTWPTELTEMENAVVCFTALARIDDSGYIHLWRDWLLQSADDETLKERNHSGIRRLSSGVA